MRQTVDPPAHSLDFSDTEIAFSNKSDSELRRTARLFRLMNNHRLVSIASYIGLRATKWRLPFADWFVEQTIFPQFCGGKTLAETRGVIDKLWEFGTLTMLDYGAEGKAAEEDLDAALVEFLRAVDFAAKNESTPVVTTKITSLAPNAILEKWQTERSFSEKEQKSFDRTIERLDQICRRAYEQGVGVFIDAEESWMQDTVDYLTEMMMSRYNQERAIVYNTYQLYRHDKLQYLIDAHSRATEQGYVLGAKLVRGAYMVKERKRAEELGYSSPIQPDKASTDRDFNLAVKYCVENYETIASCNASHNVESVRLQADMIVRMGLPRKHPHLIFCQLYGMSDYITFNLANAGFNVAKYVVYGPIKEVVPYLIRRAEENTSVTGDMSRELRFITTEMERRNL